MMFNINVDRTTNISISFNDVSLELGEVVITAQTPMVQKDLTSSISVIRREEIEELPVADFTELLQLQAGVIGDGNNLHLRGGRSNEVAYLIDGLYVTDPLLGGLATSIGNDAIQEMSMLSGTFNAEYGNALSGIVNIVTRDGSDKWAGKIEFRTSQFGISRYADLEENKINGNIGGPVFTDNLRLFISGELDNRGSYLPFGYNKSSSGFGKLTFNGIRGIKLGLSLRGSKGKRQNYSNAYRFIPDQYLKRKNDSFQSSLSLTHSLSSNFFYDIKVSYFNQGYYSGLNKDISDYLPPNEEEFLPIGTGFEYFKRSDPESITDSRTATLDLKTDIVWQMGNVNEVKFGVQYKKHWLRLFDILGPTRPFPYIDDYSTNPFEAAAYIQDKIELSYLVINLGLRADYVNSNARFRSNPLDPNTFVDSKPRFQLSPRIGIAHPISERTKLHFAYGHFFQNPDYQYLFANQKYDLDVREPLFGQPDLDAQRTIAYEVGVSHQFTDKIAMSVTAYYKDVTGLIGTSYFFPFVDGRFVGYTLYVNEDYANMKGFEINLDARTDKYFSGGITYTFASAKGSASSETEQYPGTQESTRLYFLNFDKTHSLNASATLYIPSGEGPEIFGRNIFEDMDFSFIFRASSGYPYTASGRDIGFVERNSLRLPAGYTIDLKIKKNFDLFGLLRMKIFLEILNLTDHRNILFVYGDTGSPDYTNNNDNSDLYNRNPANYGPPRSVRLGLGINF